MAIPRGTRLMFFFLTLDGRSSSESVVIDKWIHGDADKVVFETLNDEGIRERLTMEVIR